MTRAGTKELDKYGRVTLYAAQKKRRELLKKIMERTNAKTLSEAVFQAISYYIEHTDKKTKEELLAQSKGIWGNNPDIDKAMAELAQGWEEWRKKF